MGGGRAGKTHMVFKMSENGQIIFDSRLGRLKFYSQLIVVFTFSQDMFYGERNTVTRANRGGGSENYELGAFVWISCLLWDLVFQWRI